MQITPLCPPRRHLPPRFIALLLVPALLAFLSGATANAAAQRVGVPEFAGQHEEVARKAVMAVLKAHGYQLVKSREMAEGISRSGAKPDSEQGFQTIARELALSSIISGALGKRTLWVIVRNGSDGAVLGKAAFSGTNPRKLAADVGHSFWTKLGSAISSGQPPTGAKTPPPAPVAEAPEDREDSSALAGGESAGGGDRGAAAPADSGDADTGRRRRGKARRQSGSSDEEGNVIAAQGEEAETASSSLLPTLDLAAGPRIITRSLSYNQDQSRLRPYSLGPGTGVAASAVWYPLASFMTGVITGLGVEASLEQGIGINSSLAGGASYGSVVHEYSGGVRFRLPFGDGHFAYASVTGGEHAFTFTSKGANVRADLPDLPDTFYRYVRPGLGVGLSLPQKLSLVVSVGYRAVLNRGGDSGAGIGSSAFFPRATVMGVDASATVGYQVVEHFDVRAGVDFRRYGFSMHSQANDGYITGGAVDQYICFNVLAAFTWGAAPHAGSAAGGESEEEAPADEAAKPSKKRAGGGDGDDEQPAEGSGDEPEKDGAEQ